MSFSFWQKPKLLHMKILTVSNYYPDHPGGIEIVAQNLVSQWRKSHHVRWAACDVATCPHKYNVDDVLLPANNFFETRLGFPYPIPNWNSILNICKQVQWSDIVHIHDCLYFANFIAFLASLYFSKPLIVTQHIGLVPYREKYKNVIQKIAYRTIGRLVLGYSDEVAFINKHVKNWFEANMKVPKASLIQNGVDHHIFYPPSANERQTIRTKMGYADNDIVLLFIGRFTQKKGVNLIREIAMARPNYHWLILGSGEIDVSRWNFPNIKVFPHQPQPTLREFYIAADVFVLPSRGEGFPLAVQEALSCGLPAAVSEEIASSLPDAPLIGLDTSSLPNLLNKLDNMLAKPGSLTFISHQSREYAKQWDWSVVARQYEDLFIRLTNDFSKGST